VDDLPSPPHAPLEWVRRALDELLGLPEAVRHSMGKANLALHIPRTIEERKLTQAQAATLLGLDQPKVSSIIF